VEFVTNGLGMDQSLAQYGWDRLEEIGRRLLDGAAEIAGCIDNVGADGLFGWAWSPQFPEVNLPLEITADGGSSARPQRLSCARTCFRSGTALATTVFVLAFRSTYRIRSISVSGCRARASRRRRSLSVARQLPDNRMSSICST
jgi:hypothetical protein